MGNSNGWNNSFLEIKQNDNGFDLDEFVLEVEKLTNQPNFAGIIIGCCGAALFIAIVGVVFAKIYK
jgi:hypothetical protein